MSPPDSSTAPKIRRDGWTAERQLHLLDALASTRNVRAAAAAAGMSREGAHRLRNRCEGSLFALLWDRAHAPEPAPRKVHMDQFTDGQIARLLGNHFRLERGDLSGRGRFGSKMLPGDRT